MTTKYSCLFTKHKTQKRKTWHDGKLVVEPSGRVTLEQSFCHLVNSSAVDAIDLQLSGVVAIKSGTLTELELEKHLVTIEGPWVPPVQNQITTGSSAL